MKKKEKKKIQVFGDQIVLYSPNKTVYDFDNVCLVKGESEIELKGYMTIDTIPLGESLTAKEVILFYKSVQSPECTGKVLEIVYNVLKKERVVENNGFDLQIIHSGKRFCETRRLALERRSSNGHIESIRLDRCVYLQGDELILDLKILMKY